MWLAWMKNCKSQAKASCCKNLSILIVNKTSKQTIKNRNGFCYSYDGEDMFDSNSDADTVVIASDDDSIYF